MDNNNNCNCAGNHNHHNGDCGCNHEHNHHDHEGCGCGHDHEEVQTIHLSLDDGTELDCIVLATFEIKGKDYIALLPEEHEDVFLYEFNETEEGMELKNIEDDEEFELVAKAFNEAFEEDEE